MKTLFQIVKAFRSELLAVIAILVQHFLGIAPQVPWWVTGGLVLVGSRVGILTTTTAAEIEWLNKRVFILEFVLSSSRESAYHPETYTRQAMQDVHPYAGTVYRLFDEDGQRCAVMFEDLPKFMSWGPRDDGKYKLLTDLEPQEIPVDEEDPTCGKQYQYKTVVMDAATRQEVLDYVDRVAPRESLASARNVLFDR